MPRCASAGGAVSWARRSRTTGAAAQHRAGVRDSQALPRARPAGGDPWRTDRTRQRRRRRARRDRSLARSHECHRARRCLGALVARTSRRQARQRATRGRGARHGISARSRRARQRHRRRQHLDQCGRPARAALRDDAQPGAGHRGRAGRWHGAHLAEPHAQEQRRLRPEAIVHRQRRHARRRDARRAAPGLAHPQPGDAAGVVAELRGHGGIVRPPGLRAGRAAGGLRGAVGQLLRLQHHARRGQRGSAARAAHRTT